MSGKNNKLRCPKCGNTNIVKVGIFFQCHSKNGERNHVSCGWTGKKEVFQVIQQQKFS